MDYWAILTLVAASWLLYQGISGLYSMYSLPSSASVSPYVQAINYGNTAVGGLLVFHFIAQMWSAFRAPPVPAPTLANTILGAARKMFR
jgi:hypothetical protein